MALLAALSFMLAQHSQTILLPRFSMSFSDTGRLENLVIQGSGNLALLDQDSALLCLRIDGKVEKPTSLVVKDKTFKFKYPQGQATVQMKNRGNYVTFELVDVKVTGHVELAIWGPLATSLDESIGETVGVVQRHGKAFGVQILNAKTLGGYPNTEDDVEPSYDIFATGDLSDAKADTGELYRGDTARGLPGGGSVVQAYTRDRSQTREIKNWGHDHYTAPAYRDGGLIGSKIALFGCNSEDALSAMGEIERQEGLPHPMIDGVWAKISPAATESYIVTGFDTRNLDACLELTKKAGLKYLYTDGCFETWGHFKLHPDGFPKNWESMKECVDRAVRVGVRLGAHTLSNFITTNDPYVTPVPDKRLAEVGDSRLAAALDATMTEISVEDGKFFDQFANNALKTARVGNELIQYAAVTNNRLTGCKRGAFGTKAASHGAGDRIAKLMDHGYGTFLTNADLTKEVAHNIARLFNETGLQQLSMDGLEGNWSTGMGQYGRALFAETWYNALSPKLRGQVINDASNPGAFNWHINTRENWGEPWYAGFRKSQTQYRLKNQHYFKRNFMPAMLGWFQMGPETTLEDMQWLLARAAGFDAGFCIVTSLDGVAKNPNGEKILAAVKAWESARHAHAFPTRMQSDLRDINNEYDLEQVAPGHWAITRMNIGRLEFKGDRVEGKFSLDRFRETARLIFQVPQGVRGEHLALSIDGVPVADFPATVDGYKYFDVGLGKYQPGPHSIALTGSVSDATDAHIDIEVRVPTGKPRGLPGKS